MAMNFCNHCGAPLQYRTPPGDDRSRLVCSSCRTVHYQNPKIVVGCIPEWKGKILLCRRSIEPRYGLWTIPAGFLENGETLIEGAQREAFEEAGARLHNLALYTIFDLTYFHQVYMIFRSELLDSGFAAGEESLEVRLFDEHRIPWGHIAFTAVKKSLRLFFQDRPTGRYPLHLDFIAPAAERPEAGRGHV